MFEEAPKSPAEKEKNFLQNTHLKSGVERAKEAKLYFVFDNQEQRDGAINMIYKLRNELLNENPDSEDFRFFSGCTVDKFREQEGHHDGIEIDLTKNPKNIRHIFENYLITHGFFPKREFETHDGVPISIDEEN